MKLAYDDGTLGLDTLMDAALLGGPVPVSAALRRAQRPGSRKAHIAAASQNNRADAALRKFSWDPPTT